MDILWKILIPVCTSLILGFLGWMAKQITAMKKADEERDNELLKRVIGEEVDTRLVNIKKDLEDLRDILGAQIHREEELESNLLGSYKFRLIQLCRIYIEQQYMTQEQYDQLGEMYKLYVYLGGNGQAKDYYDRVKLLPIRKDVRNPQDAFRDENNKK